LGEKFSTSVFRDVQPLLGRIYGHPFITELAAGTLSPERFKVFIRQDWLYLIDFSHALAITAGRARESHIERILEASKMCLVVEREMHAGYFTRYGISTKLTDARKTPACIGYTSYLLAKAASGGVGEAMAALTPCFWIYREVGLHIVQQAEQAKNNPYSDWIDTYADKEFSDIVDGFVGLTDEVADEAGQPERDRMVKAFMTASRFEYHFWDDAYKMEEEY
jgi:thiaminase/transcriptional activator TenA